MSGYKTNEPPLPMDLTLSVDMQYTHLCWQLLHHLPPQGLHVWHTYHIYGHFTVLPQSVQVAIALQVVIQELLCVFHVGPINAGLDIFCDDTFTSEPLQALLWVDTSEKFILMFLEKSSD